MKQVISEKVYNIIATYASNKVIRRRKKRFWSHLDEVITHRPETEKLIVAGDLNGHVSEDGEGMERKQLVGETRKAITSSILHEEST